MLRHTFENKENRELPTQLGTDLQRALLQLEEERGYWKRKVRVTYALLIGSWVLLGYWLWVWLRV